MIIALASALGGGLVGGLVVHVARPRAPVRAEAAPESSAGAEESGALERRVGRLEQQLQYSERRQRTVDALQKMAQEKSPDGGSAAVTRSAVDDPVFEAAVRDVLDQVETERSLERKERRTERVRAMADRFVERLTPDLGLNEAQKQKLLSILREHFEAMMQGAAQSDGGVPAPDQWRARQRERREKLDQKLGEVLSEPQLKKMRELQESGELPGFGGRGRGRGRGFD